MDYNENKIKCLCVIISEISFMSFSNINQLSFITYDLSNHCDAGEIF